MRKLLFPALGTVALAAGALLAVPSAAQAAPAPTTHRVTTAVAHPAVNSCSYTSIGFYCGYYSGSAETEEWSTNTAAVKEIQDIINQTTAFTATGHAALTVDGSFGPLTLAAVKWFQGYYIGASQVDGNVGPITWAALRD